MPSYNRRKSDGRVFDIRTVGMYWKCGVCGLTKAPQMVVAVFERFRDALTGRFALRVKHFECLRH